MDAGAPSFPDDWDQKRAASGLGRAIPPSGLGVRFPANGPETGLPASGRRVKVAWAETGQQKAGSPDRMRTVARGLHAAQARPWSERMEG